ncbi:MAG: hypothetical protein ACLGXA_08070 [Acidobacteriota bacterium]
MSRITDTLRFVVIAFLLAAGLQAQSSGLYAYLIPGPFAICRFWNNPVLCGVWEAQGKPVVYDLYISTSNAQVVGYSYTVSGTLNGQVVSRSGVVQRTDVPGAGSATVVQLSFGGTISGAMVTVSEMVIAGTFAE